MQPTRGDGCADRLSIPFYALPYTQVGIAIGIVVFSDDALMQEDDAYY